MKYEYKTISSQEFEEIATRLMTKHSNQVVVSMKLLDLVNLPKIFPMALDGRIFWLSDSHLVGVILSNKHLNPA